MGGWDYSSSPAVASLTCTASRLAMAARTPHPRSERSHASSVRRQLDPQPLWASTGKQLPSLAPSFLDLHPIRSGNIHHTYRGYFSYLIGLIIMIITQGSAYHGELTPAGHPKLTQRPPTALPITRRHVASALAARIGPPDAARTHCSTAARQPGVGHW